MLSGASRRMVQMLLLGCCIAQTAGCPQLESWKQQQIASGKQAAAPAKVVLPAAPISLPREVEQAVPLDDSFTIISFQQSAEGFRLELLSSFDAAMSAQWLQANMLQRGYEATDNPSRIVEEGGLEFHKQGEKYPTISAQVILNTSDQVLIRYEAAR